MAHKSLNHPISVTKFPSLGQIISVEDFYCLQRSAPSGIYCPQTMKPDRADHPFAQHKLKTVLMGMQTKDK